MIPINLKIKNFFSHKETEIDFTKFNSALLIGNVEGDYNISNGSGKCLSGNTILTSPLTGERISIRDLYNCKKPFSVWGLDKNLKLSPSEITAIQLSGKKEILKITLENGYEECVSTTHPILSIDKNCVLAKDLLIGSYVAQPRHMNVLYPQKTLSMEESRLLGLYASEGGLTEGRARFTNADQDIIAKAKHGLWNKKAINRCLPPVFFSESKENVGAFLGMFFSGNGYISDIERAREISIGLGSKEFIYDLQVLLQRFGIQSSIRFKKINLIYNSWILSIHTNVDNFIKFYALVNDKLYGPKKYRLEKFNEFIIKLNSNPNKDIIPSALYCDKIIEYKKNYKHSNIDLSNNQLKNTNLSRKKLKKYAEIVNDKDLLLLSDSDIVWTKIKSIENIGVQETYDIEIDNDTHLYALNGFITHNSALFEAILWCLFNKARTASMDDVVMWNETNCSVSFEFIHHGERYKIIRDRSRTTGTSTVEFFIDDQGSWIDKSGSTARLTNDEIISVIHVDYKTFINSAYFRQNDISEFAESDAGRKKEILKNIIDLSKWDEYEKTAKNDVKLLKQECIILEAESNELNDTRQSLAESEFKFKELTRLVDSKGLEREDVAHRLESLSEKYTSLKQSLDTDKWDKITDENAKLTTSLSIIEGKKDSLLKEICDYEKQVSVMNIKISEFQEELVNIKLDPEAPNKLLLCRDEKNKYKAEISSNKERLLELESVNIIKGTCYVCGQGVAENLSEILKQEYQTKINDFKRRIVFGKNRVNQLEAEINLLEKITLDGQRFQTLTASTSSLQSEIKMLCGHLDRISNEKVEVIRHINEIQSKLKSNEDILTSLRDDNFNSLRLQIKELKQNRISVQSELESINRDVGIYSQRVINLTEKINKMQKSQKKLIEKGKELIILEKFVKLLGKNGIQTILLNAVIEDLELVSNDILSSICNEPFQVILETQRLGADGSSIVDTLDLKVKKDGIIQNFKSLSGGEQFRISLALRIALSEISSKHGGSSLDFLLLDEINSPLDRHGTENLFVNVIKSLEQKYKILVITHDDLLKEKFDFILDVTKINGESTTKFISK